MHEFTEDINEDGKKEKIVFSNHYRFYDKMNVTDVGYTSNHIKIYIDNNKIYSQKLRTVSHLSEPEIVDIDSSKANTGIKHIFVKDKGGGDVII